jgi:LysM repeat protein
VPENYVEVTVKKGDMLEKIARANGTTVQAIKDANKLANDKLKIGQVLKIPVGGTSTQKIAEASKPAAAAAPAAPSGPAAAGDPVYYTVKSGDNPWKIAKQFGVKFEDILKLNNMTEEQSRKLKVGDKIRVK